MADIHYGVLISEEAAKQLEPIAKPWLRHGDGIAYFNCKSVNPDGAFVHMVLEAPGLSGTLEEAELQIPHHFVKAILNYKDLKRVGFA